MYTYRCAQRCTSPR